MKVIIIGFIFLLIFHYSLILNLNQPLGLGHGDSFQTNFILKHYIDTARSGNLFNLSNLPMVYPLKNSLFYSESHLLQGVLAIPINFLTQNIITTTNSLALLIVLLSFLAMFVLANFWTQNFWASITAGVIFVFGPFVMARFPDQMIVYSLPFIPLVFLFAEKSLRNPNGRNGFWLCMMLILQLISSSFYYVAFLLIFLPTYFIVRIRQLKPDLRLLLNKWSIAGGILFISAALILGYFYLQVFNKEPIGRDIIDAESYSAWPTDYLFANQRNWLYGPLKERLLQSSPNLELSKFSSLNGLFLGIIPIMLLVLSFKLVKGPQRSVLWLFWGLLVLALLLSFGPKIHITRQLALPGPYRLIYEIPVFKFLRDISRFGIMVVFFSSLISALTLDALSKKIPGKGVLIMIVILSLLVVEYWNKPLDFTNFNPDTLKFYQKLNSNPQIKVILDYPIGNSLDGRLGGARPAEFDAYYLLLGSTLHNKILFNGYNAFLPKEYYVRTNQLSTVFPTALKIKLLKSWGVDAIVLHKDQFFIPNQFEITKERLKALVIPISAENKEEVLYTLYNYVP